MLEKKRALRRDFGRMGGRILLLCLLSAFFLSLSGQAAFIGGSRVVRVGFFDFEGYHETNQQNQRGGYGYEYLHEMAKYTGWIFEYVDGTWEECQEMLKNGKIDLLTSAQYSQARDQIFDFSDTSMGTSYAQLTVSADNITYGRNDFPEFSGIHVGLLNGNSRNAALAHFAAEKGFTYTSTLYETQDELDRALKTGEVDAVLTSSLRKLNNEAIIAQFAPSPFYAVVKAGNQELLDEVNLALEAIEMNNPAFRYNLYQEFYGVDTGDTFVLSREEKEYLATMPTLRAVMPADAAPIAYWEEGKQQGISADLMTYLLADLNIPVTYIRTESLSRAHELLQSGEADLACLFESDYNLAEQYGMRITAPYLTTKYSMISRQQRSQTPSATQTIATVAGAVAGTAYLSARYPTAQQLPVESTGAAIAAVADGTADFALVNVYAAERALASYPNLRASFVDGVEQQFSIGVNQTVDARLYSILDKKINTMSSQALNDILSRHTMFQQTAPDLTTYFRQHPKEFLLISGAVVAGIVGILLYIVWINRRHAKNVYALAYVDQLTKLWNGNGFLLHGNALLAQHAAAPWAVIALDLSNFSGINEDYGRQTGDKVIEGMGAILKRFESQRAVVAHTDADHFLLLLSYADQQELHNTLTAIASMLSSYQIEDLLLRFHAYIGVGFVEAQEEDALLHAIDHAGIARGQCSDQQSVVYMDKTLRESLLREKDIRDHVESGLARGEFQVYYQPKINMMTGDIVGAEALIRWNHSKLGFLNPAEFIPLIEQNGLITEVDFFVLEQTCKLVRGWMDAGQTPIILSVNQSRAHFLKSNYIQRLREVITRYNIPPDHIELEITETLFGQEAISNELIKQIRSLGLMISIDDFGSGYSSLHLLHQITVDMIKIDKGLLDESDKQEKMRNIIHRVVQIAADLDVDVICEGVETREQVGFLLGIGCKYAQGFLFSKPLPLAEFAALLEKGALRM